jgi:peptide/nickel transport system ATP-binding protein
MLEVRDLSIGFGSRERRISAVQSLSFSLGEGETLAIVGESGSGKSVTALALTRLLPEPPAIYETGDIFLDGKPILSMNEKMLRSVRGNRIAYIFQEPATSLNPVYSIYQQIAERSVNIALRCAICAKRSFIGWIRLGLSIPRSGSMTILFSSVAECNNA